MALDLLLAELKAPCSLVGLSDVLARVEQKVRAAPSSFWEAEGIKPYEDTYTAVLLTRMKFLLLAVEAQHARIVELQFPKPARRRGLRR